MNIICLLLIGLIQSQLQLSYIDEDEWLRIESTVNKRTSRMLRGGNSSKYICKECYYFKLFCPD
jgi:hypothetical protein